MSTSLSEFSTAVEKLDEDGANWVMFKRRFMIAVGQKDVEGHFDGSEKKPVLSEGASSEVKRAFEADLKQWTKKEKLALYLLTVQYGIDGSIVLLPYPCCKSSARPTRWTVDGTEITRLCHMKYGRQWTHDSARSPVECWTATPLKMHHTTISVIGEPCGFHSTPYQF